MPSISGTIKRTAHSTQFVGTFTLGGDQVVFTGDTSAAGDAFETEEAELTYEYERDLTARRSFEGKIGKSTIRISFYNGPEMTGSLKAAVDPASTVVGHGSWTRLSPD